MDPVKVNGRPLEVVSSAKILGLNVSDDLKWNVHIAELVKKASSRLFSLKQLKRSAVPLVNLFFSTLLASDQYLNMHVQSSTGRCHRTLVTT